MTKPPIIRLSRRGVSFPRWPRLDAWLEEHEGEIVLTSMVAALVAWLVAAVAGGWIPL